MVRKLLLSGDEVVGYVEHRLRPYVGIVAEIADHRPLLDAVLQDYFHGTCPRSAKSLVLGYGVPSDVATEIQDAIANDIIGVITRGFQRVYPGRIYRYSIDGNNDVLVEEYTPHDPSLMEAAPDAENDDAHMAAVDTKSTIQYRAPINAAVTNVNPEIQKSRTHRRLFKCFEPKD